MPQTGTQTQVKVRPLSLTPTYNETIVVLESPNIQSKNFKWIVDIYKGESTEADYKLLSTIVILPNPEGYGVIDFHRHIENNISTSFYPADVDKISNKVTNEGLKWTYEVKEQFSNTVWAFENNYTTAGTFVGWTSSTDKHPYIVGDVINIVQSAGATHSSYDGQATVTVVVDEYTVLTDKAYVSSTPTAEGGVSNLVDTNSRTIEQVIISPTNLVYSFNGALTFQDFRNWDPFNYRMSNTSSSSTKFLLDGLNTFDVTLSDRVWINNFMDTTYFRGLKIETDNGVFTVEQTFNPTGQHFINQNKIGAKDILESSDTFLTVSGSLPIVDLNTTFIKITPLDALLTTAVGETVTLNVKEECSKYEAIRFFYMDKLGSYLPITFNKVSKKNITNTRSNYKQNYGSYDSVSNVWGYTTYDRGTTTYDLTTKEVITCTSEWITEDASKMVIAMLNSPNVYIQSSIGEYIAINITTNSYEDKKTVNEKLINYTISFEHANTNTNQRG